MTANEYQREAMRTLNPALSQQDILVNGVMGLCGEAGKVINIVKKHLAQGHPLDREALIRELGDVAWYLAETATALDLDLDAVLSKILQSCARVTLKVSRRSNRCAGMRYQSLTNEIRHATIRNMKCFDGDKYPPRFA